MIDETELLTLLADLESDRVERTTATEKTDKFSEAICAFANDMPNHRKSGYLIVGVYDDGRLSGLKVTDKLLQSLGALRDQGNILPLPAMTVARFVLPGGEVAAVEVKPSDLPPVRYKGQVWIRVGPRRAIASEQEERILGERRTSRAHTLDATPCMEASLGDLDLELFADYRRHAVAEEAIRENHRGIKEQLASLRFYDLTNDRPTYAGVILFGKNPRYFLAGAYVQYLRMPEADLTDTPISQAEIGGDLRTVVRELELRARVEIEVGMTRATLFRDVLLPAYPYHAIRELFMNALVHRDYLSTAPVRFYWYRGHVEIMNPGGLYGEVTPENINYRNGYRNPVIAEAMKTLGFTNKFGSGVATARKSFETNGNPEPEFTFDPHTVRVVAKERIA